MLSEAQLAHLEHIVHSISTELEYRGGDAGRPADVNIGAV
jgi:hypothetical protein